MSRKWFIFLNLMSMLLLEASIVIWAASPSPAAAQCGDNPPPKSSCITCHEKEYPVYQNGEWHGIHALKDCCTNCHGGNCTAMDKDLAHQSLVANPLEDIYINCYRCHPDDYQAKAKRFAIVLGITPSSSPTATPFPTEAVAGNPIVILPPTTPTAPGQQFWLPILGGLAFVSIVLLTLGALLFRFRIHGNTQS